MFDEEYDSRNIFEEIPTNIVGDGKKIIMLVDKHSSDLIGFM